MARQINILLKNGNFWTGNRDHPFAKDIGIEAGRIAFVDDIQTSGSRPECEIDLEGRFAMPGFIDAHTHFRLGGASLHELNLRNVKSEENFSESVRIFADRIPAGKWILGGNWDHENWESGRLPTKELIDRFTPGRPVFLDRIDTHMALVNTLVLRLAGIDRNTPDPPGGVIVRDTTSEPTGIVKDAARELVLRFIPEPTFEDRVTLARSAVEFATSLGITSVHDMSPEVELRAFVELEKRGVLTVRIYSVPPIADYSKLVAQGIKADCEPQDDRWIKRGAVKAFADGSLGSGTAWFFEPFEDEPSNNGIATEIMSSGKLQAYAKEADLHHIQLAIHAIGDRAVSNVLDIFEEAGRANPSWERRFRIEHAQHLRENDFVRFGKLGVIASVQPYHCIDDGRWAERRIGPRRAVTSFAFRRMIDAHIPLAFGTDWPVAPLNPFETIFAAVTRSTTDGKYPDGWIPDQKLTVEESLRAYTLGSAYASFSENETGTIEAGKFADLIVLSQNPFEVEPEEIREIKVLMTIVDGKIVFGEGQFSERRERPAS